MYSYDCILEYLVKNRLQNQIWRKWRCKLKYCGKSYNYSEKSEPYTHSYRVSSHNAKDGENGARVANSGKDCKNEDNVWENKIDETQQYMEHLKEVVAAGRATLSMYTEVSDTNIIIQ